MNLYFDKYIKYKMKYLNLIGGSKSTALSIDIFKDILSPSFNKQTFLKKYLRTIDNYRDTVNDDGLCPLSLYIFNGGRDLKIIEFLFPKNLDLFDNVDSNGNNIFHKLVLEGNINLLEDFYFKDTTIASKIINSRNKKGQTILMLAATNFPDNPTLVSELELMFQIDQYEDNKNLWENRRKQSSRLDKSSTIGKYNTIVSKSSGRSAISSVEIPDTVVSGKRKVHNNLLKNLDELQKVKNEVPLRRNKRDIVFKYHYMTTRMLNAYISNGQITKIDTLYLVKKIDLHESRQINLEIPKNWIVDNIRFLDNFDLPDKTNTFDFIVQLEYDYTEQEDEEDEEDEDGEDNEDEENEGQYIEECAKVGDTSRTDYDRYAEKHDVYDYI
jgi:hypothetical protein